MNSTHVGCGPECRYRQMYEGSQQSLSDMAARQAQAVDRLGRLRSAMSAALKRRFPRLVLDAEAALGRRLSDLDDELLVAQLEALLLSTRASGADRLKAALEKAGFSLPEGAELGAWAESVERQASRLRTLSVEHDGDLAELFATQDVDDLAELFGPAPAGLDAAGSGSSVAVGDKEAGGVGGGVGGVGRNENVASQGNAATPATSQVGASFTAGPTMRPEVAPKSTRGGRARAAKARAVSPERMLPLLDSLSGEQEPSPSHGKNSGFLSSGAPTAVVSAGLTDDPSATLWLTPPVKQALLSGVCIPRPVFASDLVATAGSMERVALWEEVCRKEDLPVRIVPAKMRHLRRGSLIFPVGEARALVSEFGRSVWGDVLASKERSYRGGRLYELAVFLHRTAEQVVSHRLDPYTATFRLSQPGGLTGVVLFLGGDLDNPELASELVARVGELVTERLAGVAVLSASGDATGFEKMVNLIADAAANNGWQPTMPVVGGLSWEYADSRGATTSMILGS